MNIPAWPRWRSTPELHGRMLDLDHEVSVRTIQRDLDWLSAMFPLLSEQVGRTLRWQWMRKAIGLEVPGMSHLTALVFQQASRYLRPLMPASELELLEPYFQRANQALAHTRWEDWGSKVMHIESGPRLRPPEIAPQVRGVVYEALLEGTRLEVEYIPRYENAPRTYEVNPLGIVTREGLTYLVCTLWDYSDVRQLALHRVQAARLLDKPAASIEGFDLARYVHEEFAFAFPESRKPMRLEVLFDEGAAFHLTERPLTEDQEIARTRDGRFRLTATVAETSELRWWLLGFGDQVEVVAPKKLRQEFKETAENMAGFYR